MHTHTNTVLRTVHTNVERLNLAIQPILKRFRSPYIRDNEFVANFYNYFTCSLINICSLYCFIIDLTTDDITNRFTSEQTLKIDIQLIKRAFSSQNHKKNSTLLFSQLRRNMMKFTAIQQKFFFLQFSLKHYNWVKKTIALYCWNKFFDSLSQVGLQ